MEKPNEKGKWAGEGAIGGAWTESAERSVCRAMGNAWYFQVASFEEAISAQLLAISE